MTAASMLRWPGFGWAVVTVVVVVLVAPVVGSSPVRAAPAVKAVGSWSMVPLVKDANGDGFIDGDGGVPAAGALSLDPSTRLVGAGNFIAQPHERLIGGALSWYLEDAGYPVELNACRSRGTRYVWAITDSAGSPVVTTTPRALGKKTCRRSLLLPEGSYTARLTVTSLGAKSTVALPLTVQNLLMVVLGDSYASGEGNPRNVEAWLRSGGMFTGFRPYWDDEPCRRSVHGGAAQAALALEQASARTSVTLVDVSCSGATIDAGILGPQTSAGQTTSQIEQVRGIIGSRPIDLVSLTVGGNDVGFTSILTSCATKANCPVQPASTRPLTGFPTLQDGAQARIAALPGAYARVAACLGGTSCALAGPGQDAALPLSPGAAVLPTLYPDITRAASGGPCTYLTMDAQDFRWARDTLLVPSPGPSYAYTLTTGRTVPLSVAAGTLNSQVVATAGLGWRPVTGAWEASGDSTTGHGVCAGSQAWVFGLTALAGFANASFHPNPAGQRTLGQAIAAAAQAALMNPR